MNLTCPSCDSTFRIDPDQIGPAGRQVRCGSCGHGWTQPQLSEDETPAAVEAPAAAEAPAEPEVQAPPPEEGPLQEEPPAEEKPAAVLSASRRRGTKPRATPPPGASGRRIAAGWIIFFLVAGALAAGAYFGRAQIVAALPAAAELYRLAGLPVEPPLGDGLELRDVKSVRRLIDGERVVVIEGTVANISDGPRDIPQLRASVTDGTGAQVEEWVFSANSANLPPGGVTEFETSTRNAPREGSLGIDFVATK